MYHPVFSIHETGHCWRQKLCKAKPIVHGAWLCLSWRLGSYLVPNWGSKSHEICVLCQNKNPTHTSTTRLNLLSTSALGAHARLPKMKSQTLLKQNSLHLLVSPSVQSWWHCSSWKSHDTLASSTSAKIGVLHSSAVILTLQIVWYWHLTYHENPRFPTQVLVGGKTVFTKKLMWQNLKEPIREF